MVLEAKAQLKVNVGIETLWKTLAKDLRFVLPKIFFPKIEKVELVEGEGGPGSVLLIHFASDVSEMGTQKDKIVVLDESQHRLGLQVVDGIMLKRGFSYFQTIFELTTIAEQHSLVDVKVEYEYETQSEEAGGTEMVDMATKQALTFLQLLEKYLLECTL